MARLLLLIALVLLAGCAPGYPIGPLPVVPDPGRAATVIFVRPSHFAGAGATITLTIDGVETYELGTGEHVAVPVSAGERIVGLKTWSPNILFSRIYPTQTIQAEPSRTYYFRVEPDGRIDRATEAEGRELVAKTKPVASDATGPCTP